MYSRKVELPEDLSESALIEEVERLNRDAKIHVLTHALHYASAVFEGERAYGGVVFKGHEHSLRLHKSAKILGFHVPASAEEIDQIWAYIRSRADG